MWFEFWDCRIQNLTISTNFKIELIHFRNLIHPTISDLNSNHLKFNIFNQLNIIIQVPKSTILTKRNPESIQNQSRFKSKFIPPYQIQWTNEQMYWTNADLKSKKSKKNQI